MGQGLECAFRVGHGGGGHAPGTDGRAHEMDAVPALRQPLAKQVLVEVGEHQALGAAGRSRNQADVSG